MTTDKDSNTQKPSADIPIANDIVFSTETTDEDMTESIMDKYGARYSKDGRRLLKGPVHFSHFNVKEGTEVICNKAFTGCSNLTSINIPLSVTTIGASTFSGCSKLTYVNIPPSVHTMGNPFYDWSGHIETSSPLFIYEDEVIFGVEKKILIAFRSNADSYIIPESVTCIGDYAFTDCSKLTSIIIPKSVKEIGKDAFKGCSNLTSVIIPESVTRIDDNAFDGCSSLTSINIPNSVTSIGQETFTGCSSLESISIPPSVQTIKKDAFFRWNGHLEIDSPYFKYDNEALIDIKKGILVLFRSKADSYTIPSDVRIISTNAFYGNQTLKSLTIPSSIEFIRANTFDQCQKLELIEIPPNAKVARRAFWDCRNLKHIELNAEMMELSIEDYYNVSRKKIITISILDGVTCIKRNEFGGCSNLISIDIPTSVESIGSGAF